MPIIKHQCGNCSAMLDESDLQPIKDISQRVEPGEVMPSGECPDCGALCHPVEIAPRPNFRVCQNPDSHASFYIVGETRDDSQLDQTYEDHINKALAAFERRDPVRDAAPDMLAALNAALPILNWAAHRWVDAEAPKELVLAAIAKAEGGAA